MSCFGPQCCVDNIWRFLLKINNFHLILAAYLLYFLIIFGQKCILALFSSHLHPLPFFFFFFRDLRSRSDGANSPIRIRHSERAAYFLFVSHGQPSASRLPYHPLRGWYHTPSGCDNETFNAHTRVSCNFGLFEPVSGLILRQGFGQNCILGFLKWYLLELMNETNCSSLRNA